MSPEDRKMARRRSRPPMTDRPAGPPAPPEQGNDQPDPATLRNGEQGGEGRDRRENQPPIAPTPQGAPEGAIRPPQEAG